MPITATRLAPIASDPADVRAMMGQAPSGVAALGAEVDGERIGMIASSFTTGVSYDPPLVLFSAQSSSRTWPRLRRAGRIGVSLLADDQSFACTQLSSRSGDRFAGLDSEVTDDGAILLAGSPLQFECSIVSVTPAGDHEIVLLEVRAAAAIDERSPIVYHRRRLHGIAAL
ncbi:flavin reductase family protein [Microbacterium indicum]|uniref:flavin reductase family protein n=1 Tax=Microbacterium indicum TaxID=358100 RepID=UPI000685F652|nr:flavin reductase family protein [Microbacterium indicum]